MAALKAETGAPARALETVSVATVATVMAHIAEKVVAASRKRVIVVPRSLVNTKDKPTATLRA
jgi:hypothetical protein